jgi:N-acetylglucosamine malate deacetylase 1
MKLDLLAFGAHPDDVEISSAGTLLKHIHLGKKAGICDLTRGELGTRGSAELRAEEAKKSSEILGLSIRVNLGLKDGFFEVNEASILKCVEQIRRFQPEIVICNSVEDRHPDHGRASKLVSEACFYAGLKKVKTSLEGKDQDSWRVKAVYHYIQDRAIKPDLVVDITPFFEKKMEAILAFSSQFHSENSKEPATPISSPEFIAYLKARAVGLGRPIQVMYAEGFTVERTPGVNSLFDII